jgi:hypothetical protein
MPAPISQFQGGNKSNLGLLFSRKGIINILKSSFVHFPVSLGVSLSSPGKASQTFLKAALSTSVFLVSLGVSMRYSLLITVANSHSSVY